MRLWSWASGSATAVVPSHKAISEHSGPDIRCSSRNGSVVARMAAIVSLPTLGDRHALASGQAVELDDHRVLVFPVPRDRCVMVVALEAGECRAGDAEGRRQLACMGLRRLEPCQGGRGAEARDSTLRALVGDSGHERCLRAGDHQVGPGFVGAWKLWKEGHFVAMSPARPGDRVLPPAGPDDDDLHRRSPRYW